MIEATFDSIMNYGAIGICLVYFMWREIQQEKKELMILEKMDVVVQNNTIALTRFYEWMKKYGGD